MIIRELKNKDISEVENIYDLYWSGQFRENISKRLKGYVDKSCEVIEQEFKYFVAEENTEVVGVSAIRKAPNHMREFTKTKNPAELYIIAVKYKGRGVGTAIRNKILEETKRFEYSEVVFYSGNTHRDSWAFHDDSDFKRVGEMVAPDGEKGQVWSLLI